MVLFLFFLLLLDRVVFGYLIWAVPDETSWASEPFFQFEYHLQRLEKERNRELHSSDNAFSRKKMILIVGSSLAQYDVLPDLWEKEAGRSVEVRLFSHQGMNSYQLLALKDRLLALEPDLVILPVNMVDLRLERPLVLGLMGDLENPLMRQAALDLLNRDIRTIYDYSSVAPEGMLHEYGGSLSSSEISAALMKSLFLSYRFRDYGWVGWKTYLQNRFSSGRSYLNYNGISVEEGNVNHRGWTGEMFSLEVTDALHKEGMLVQAPDELFIKAGRSSVHLEWSSGECEGRVRPEAGNSSSRLPLKRGWQRISMNGLAVGHRFCFRIKPSGFYSKFYGDRLALRLSKNLGLSSPRKNALRPLRREDERYLKMSSGDYDRSFRDRILDFNRSGTEYLASLYNAKTEWSGRSFDSDLPAARSFIRFQRDLQEGGVRLLIVNAPENPLTLDLYRKSKWYEGYLSFLASGGGEFLDCSRLLPKRYFYDYHHLSYYGAIAFTRILIDAPGPVNHQKTDSSAVRDADARCVGHLK